MNIHIYCSILGFKTICGICKVQESSRTENSGHLVQASTHDDNDEDDMKT